MTVKELKNAIRWANVRISEAYGKITGSKKKGSATDRKLIQRKVEKLEHKYGKGRNTLLKLGFRGKRKAELESQLSELEAFADYAETVDTRTHKRKNTQTHAAYKTFKENYGFKNLKYSDYKELVIIFGAVGDKIVNQYGSNNLMELYTHADAEQKTNFLNTMLDVMSDSKGQGWTSEQLYDEMLYRLEREQEIKQANRKRSRRK